MKKILKKMSGLSGDVDDCELTDGDRAIGVDVK